jgi:multidrug efflux pump subunit AcrA (membrane-fusion protein)
VVRAPEGLVVVRVSGDRAVRVPVTKLAWTDDLVMVRSDQLEPGDSVVVRAPDRLYTGQLLTITTAATP